MNKVALFCYSDAEPDPNGMPVSLRFWIDIKALEKLGYNITKVKFTESEYTGEFNDVILQPYKVSSDRNWLKYQYIKWFYPVFKPGQYFYPQYNSDLIKKFSEIVDRYQPDLIFYEHVRPWYAGSRLSLKTPSFVCLHDFDDVLNLGKMSLQINKRRNNRIRNQIALFREKWKNYYFKKYIFNLLKKTNGVLTCGNGDGEVLLKTLINAKFIPTPLTKEPDMKYLTKIKSRLTRKEFRNNFVKIVHVGGLSSSHNVKGVGWFLTQCFPILKENVQEHKYQINFIGSTDNTSGEIMKFKGEPNLYFKGFVKDLQKELSEADFSIVPPGFPTGFRTKIPEAFAYGLPVVTGKYDAYGVGLKPNDPRVIVADTAREYAEACIRLINDSELRCKMGKIALETWREDFDSEKVINDSAEWIESMIKD